MILVDLDEELNEHLDILRSHVDVGDEVEDLSPICRLVDELFHVSQKAAPVPLLFLFSLEPLKLEKLMRVHPLSRVFFQTSQHKFFSLWTLKFDLLHIWLILKYLVVNNWLCDTREWEFTIAQQVESDDAQCPYVNLLVRRLALLGLDQLGRHEQARPQLQLQASRWSLTVKPGREMKLIDLDAWAFWAHVVD